MTAAHASEAAAPLLLVGTDPAFAAVVRRLLADAPDRDVIVCGLAAAVAALRTSRPGLVILDADSIASPTVAVSLLALCSAAPVLAATAGRQLSSADITALRVAGAAAVLPKAGDTSGFGLLRDAPAVTRALISAARSPVPAHGGEP